MAPKKERTVYWMANLGGWASYLLISGIIMQGEQSLTPERVYALLLAFPIGVLLSHGMRSLFIRLGWLDRSIISLIPRVLLSVLVFGSLFFLLHSTLIAIVLSGPPMPWSLTLFDAFQSVLNWGLLLLFWSVLYFSYHFFQERRRKEMEALRWQASKSEMELKQLKDQLDPHFMFNCLNSIRALIEKEPEKAKEAVTKLSKTLRNSLVSSRKRTISLREELALVEDYLALERLRLEERLRTDIEIPEENMEQRIPPLLLQSVMENAIKHGIAKIPEGGTLGLKMLRKEGRLQILVSNPGTVEKGEKDESEGSGTGMANAKRRLRLLFGDDAVYRTEEANGTVRTIIELPLEHEVADDHRRR